jgi:hypothetical protein
MKKDTWLIILGVVVVIIIILVVVFYKPGSQTTLAPTATPGIGNTSPTKGEVPKDAKVYEVGETAPAGVAVPLSVSDYSTGKLRYYETKIENDVFAPNTFSCYEGDLLKIAITAVDKDADIVIPDMNMSFPLIKKGETKTLEGQMLNPGKYTFYCEKCGGLNSTAVGYIIVVPKSSEE